MPFWMITASIFLISSIAMRTQSLQADTRASLLVTAPDVGGDALGAARITLVGNVQAIPQPAVPEARNLYVTRHASSMYWADFGESRKRGICLTQVTPTGCGLALALIPG